MGAEGVRASRHGRLPRSRLWRLSAALLMRGSWVMVLTVQ